MLPSDEGEADARIFDMEEDDDFEGLQLEREVGEDKLPTATCGQDVTLQPIVRSRRHRTQNAQVRPKHSVRGQGQLRRSGASGSSRRGVAQEACEEQVL